MAANEIAKEDYFTMSDIIASGKLLLLIEMAAKDTGKISGRYGSKIAIKPAGKSRTG